jgi:transposase
MLQRRPVVDFETVDRLHAEGHSYRKIAALLKTNYQAVYRAHHSMPANGTPSAPGTPTALERTIVMGEPVSTPPEYLSTLAHDVLAQRVDTRDQRLDVLEAFMRAMEQPPMYRQGIWSVRRLAPRIWTI